MKQPIRILGICLLMLAANLVAQAQGPNSPPLDSLDNTNG